jgi:PsbP
MRSAGKTNGSTHYTIDYYVENTHYTSRFLAKVIIKDGKLYVCTGKCKAKDYDEYGSDLTAAVDSFTVLA